jgi:hypothetical protein
MIVFGEDKADEVAVKGEIFQATQGKEERKEGRTVERGSLHVSLTSTGQSDRGTLAILRLADHVMDIPIR